MTVDFEERTALCALNDIFGFEPGLAHRLLARSGSARNVFKAGKELVDEVLGPYSKYRDALGEERLDDYRKELESIRGQGARFITIRDDCYPDILMECEDAPVGLYIQTCSEPGSIFGVRPQVSIVGTRDISFYGKEWCRKLVSEMADNNNPPLIVSGFALGTDITAHVTALECGMPTVAVLPCGIDSIYPWVHRHWAEKIASTPGCALITDYRTRTQPKTINFLRRNRIIAGLSSATVLIESKIKGGGLITAGFAFDYGRDVFALPGRIDDIRSQGCNKLIRSNIAQAIDDPHMLAAALGIGAFDRRTATSLDDEIRLKYSEELQPSEIERLASFARFIKTHRGGTAEDAAAAGMDFGDAIRARGRLEADGFIECDLLQRCTIKLKNV